MYTKAINLKWKVSENVNKEVRKDRKGSGTCFDRSLHKGVTTPTTEKSILASQIPKKTKHHART